MANIANIIGKLSGIISSLDDIKTAILNGGGGGSVTASNVSVVPTSPFVSTNLQNLSVEEANAITANAGDITTINTALGNTSISGIGDGSVTGAISANNGNINTINTALGNTSISGIGDGSVTGAISSLNSSLQTTNTTVSNIAIKPIWQGNITFTGGVGKLASSSYPYTHFIPLMGVCLDANAVCTVGFDNVGDTFVVLPISLGYSGTLGCQIYGIGYN